MNSIFHMKKLPAGWQKPRSGDQHPAPAQTGSAPIQQALVDGRITEGHARALYSPCTTPQAQFAALQTVINQSLTVRQTEELVRKLGGEKPASLPKSGPSPDILALEERLRTFTGHRSQPENRQKRQKRPDPVLLF
jgi:ParB-like chromosome segregation protein Spo0J